MTRLIDADALREVIESFLGRCPEAERPWEHGYDYALKWTLGCIDAAPTIECAACEYAMRGEMDTHRGQPIGPCLGCACGSRFQRRQP